MTLKQRNSDILAIIIVVAASALTAICQFVHNREMLLDESWLALNILNRDFVGLLRPLDYQQVAPILFLWIDKVFSIIIPRSACGFRIVPLLSFLAAFLFLVPLLRRHIADLKLIVVVLGFYCFNNLVLIHGSVQGKQYMTDVLVLATMFYLVSKEFNCEKTRLWLIAATGAVAVFLSNVAPIILFTCGVYILYEEFVVSRRCRWLPWLPVFAVWLGCFGVYYYFFIAGHPTYSFMTDYWGYTFMPLDSLTGIAHFLLERSSFILSFFFPYSVPLALKLAFPIAGLAVLVWKRNWRLLILVVTPLLVHLILSALKLYPFDLRLMLYAFPSIIIAIAAGIYYPVKWLLKRFSPNALQIFVYAVPAVMFVYYLTCLLPMQKKSETRPSLEYVDAHIGECENVYLHYFVTPRYLFYERTGCYGNIAGHHITEGGWTDFYTYKRGSLSEFDRLRGRTWIIVSGQTDEDLILAHLDAAGYRRLDAFRYESKVTGSSAYLYDFGE